MRKQQHSIASKLFTAFFIFLVLPITIFMVQHIQQVRGKTSSIQYTIYENSLAPGWELRSWASRVNLANTSPVYSGSRSISFTPTRKGARLYLYTNTAVDTASYSSLHFAAQASQAEQGYNVILYSSTNKPLSAVRLAHYGGDAAPGTWKVYNIPLSDLRANATQIKGIAIQSRTPRRETLYLDSISLTGFDSSPASSATAIPTLTPTPIPQLTPTSSATSNSTLTPAPIPQLTPISSATATPTLTPTPVPQLTPASGKNLYISPSGNDTNDGSQNTPFATIGKADSVATPGTTIHVEPGIYTWTGITRQSGTATAHITFVSDTKWGAILRPSSISDYWTPGEPGTYIWYAQGSYVDIIGFDIDGSLITTGQDEGLGLAAPYVRALGNRIHNLLNGDGIYTSGDTGPDDAIGNIVFNIGTPTVTNGQIHGIYFRVANGGHIQNNIVYGVSGYGIHCWHACSNTTISNNTLFNNRTGGILFGGGDGPNFGNSLCDNMIVTNNISVNNTYYSGSTGIQEYEYSGQHTIGSHNQILNNLVDNNTGGNILLIEGNTASVTITQDPQFVNYQANGTGDYHLKATSPAIGSGTSIGAPSTDMDGVPIPQGKDYDIGPYEYI